jgi:fructokinase
LTYTYTFILGGGMMQQAHLFPFIRRKVRERLAGYVQAKEILEQTDRYIVPPKLGNQAGILGGIALAERALSMRT